MKDRVILSDQRDLPLLLFIWHWKLLSTKSLALKFFPNKSVSRTYNRLRTLEKAGYLQARLDSAGQGFVWALGKRGYDAIRRYLPPLKEEGYKSEHVDHDILVTAVHLGDSLIAAPDGLETFTEQQLRRVESEFYPAWVPATDQHRPDGYWRVRSGDATRTVALEVELTPKLSSDYQTVGDFYAEAPRIDRVLWIIPTPVTAIRIQSQFDKLQSPRAKIHNYVRIKALKEHGWQALIERGPEAGQRIESFLTGAASVHGRSETGPGRVHGPGLALFDTRKKRFSLSTSARNAES